MKATRVMCTLSLLMITPVSGTQETLIPMRHSAAHLLRSDLLQVEIMDPSDAGRYNRGARFCSLANVLRVTMRGHDYLFSPVEHDPLTENCGLCSEFDIGTATQPPGFVEASEGQGFLKIGVGVLRKDVADYDFFRPYEIIVPAQTSAKWGDHAAQFEQSCAGVNGYAYRLQAAITVEDNVLEMQYTLTNSGQKPLVTEQYAHNFFCFDDTMIGPDYAVRFPYDFTVTGLLPEQEKKGREIDFMKSFPSQVQAVNLNVLPSANNQGPNEVAVLDRACGMSILASVSRPSLRIAIHASPRYVCPEQFVLINLQPSESQQWVRRYEFRLDSADSSEGSHLGLYH
jgi:hypothetical protein